MLGSLGPDVLPFHRLPLLVLHHICTILYLYFILLVLYCTVSCTCTCTVTAVNVCCEWMCSTAEKLREKIPSVQKDLEKSQNELTNLVTQENKAANEVITCVLLTDG